METHSLIRPAATAARCCLASWRSLPIPPPAAAAIIRSAFQIPGRRQKSTTARTKKALNIPPHPSFLAADTRFEKDHVIFNPPAAAPSVYHTPFKFLPKNDPRRRANLGALFESSASIQYYGGANPRRLGPGPGLPAPGGGSGGSGTTLARTLESAPVLEGPREKTRGPVTREEVEEMRRLRAADPWRWTVQVLARHFDVPKTFIMMACQAPKEKLEKERARREKIRAQWSQARLKAWEDRKRRNQMVMRGEI